MDETLATALQLFFATITPQVPDPAVERAIEKVGDVIARVAQGPAALKVTGKVADRGLSLKRCSESGRRQRCGRVPMLPQSKRVPLIAFMKATGFQYSR